MYGYFLEQHIAESNLTGGHMLQHGCTTRLNETS